MTHAVEPPEKRVELWSRTWRVFGFRQGFALHGVVVARDALMWTWGNYVTDELHIATLSSTWTKVIPLHDGRPALDPTDQRREWYTCAVSLVHYAHDIAWYLHRIEVDLGSPSVWEWTVTESWITDRPAELESYQPEVCFRSS
jgi:hypothetical protein